MLQKEQVETSRFSLDMATQRNSRDLDISKRHQQRNTGKKVKNVNSKAFFLTGKTPRSFPHEIKTTTKKADGRT